jgi:hypothetical protein
MKANFLKLTLCGGFLAAATTTACALPLQVADLPADPAWMVHFDVDGLRPTTIGQYLLTQMEKPKAQAKLAAFQSIFNFDLRRQLHGLTLYSVGAAHEDGVLLVYADFEAGRLVTLAKAAKDAQSTTHNQHTIYNWIDEKRQVKDGVQPRVYAAIQGARVILGRREDCVAQALDVLDGKAPRLASGSAFSQSGAADGAGFIEAAARKLDLRRFDQNAALFRLTKLVRLRIGGAAEQVTATLSLDANDDEVARNMFNIGQGLVSLMKLQKEKPDLIKLAEAISLKQDGAGVVATATMPASDVLIMLKADAARKADKKMEKE